MRATRLAEKYMERDHLRNESEKDEGSLKCDATLVKIFHRQS